MLSVGKVIVLFSRFVAIFGEKYGLFKSSSFWENFFLSKSVFGYFKTDGPMTTKLEWASLM